MTDLCSDSAAIVEVIVVGGAVAGWSCDNCRAVLLVTRSTRPSNNTVAVISSGEDRAPLPTRNEDGEVVVDRVTVVVTKTIVNTAAARRRLTVLLSTLSRWKQLDRASLSRMQNRAMAENNTAHNMLALLQVKCGTVYCPGDLSPMQHDTR